MNAHTSPYQVRTVRKAVNLQGNECSNVFTTDLMAFLWPLDGEENLLSPSIKKCFAVSAPTPTSKQKLPSNHNTNYNGSRSSSSSSYYYNDENEDEDNDVCEIEGWGGVYFSLWTIANKKKKKRLDQPSHTPLL